MNLSSGETIPIIKKSQKNKANLTAETCHHYLALCAEDVEDCHTEFKTCPPIRPKANQDLLWKAIQDKTINMVVSDHSPATPGVKCLNYGKTRGDFLQAWPGVASLQFGNFVLLTIENIHMYIILLISSNLRLINILDTLPRIWFRTRGCLSCYV